MEVIHLNRHLYFKADEQVFWIIIRENTIAKYVIIICNFRRYPTVFVTIAAVAFVAVVSCLGLTIQYNYQKIKYARWRRRHLSNNNKSSDDYLAVATADSVTIASNVPEDDDPDDAAVAPLVQLSRPASRISRKQLMGTLGRRYCKFGT